MGNGRVLIREVGDGDNSTVEGIRRSGLLECCFRIRVSAAVVRETKEQTIKSNGFEK